MTRLFLNQLILRNKYLVKIFSILFFLLLVFLFIYGTLLFSTSQASIEEAVNSNFEDEIDPFCNGLNYFDNNKVEYSDLNQLEIDIYDDLGWNTNVLKYFKWG